MTWPCHRPAVRPPRASRLTRPVPPPPVDKGSSLGFCGDGVWLCGPYPHLTLGTCIGGGSALRRGGPSSTQSILIGKINSPRPSQPPTLAWDPYTCQFIRDKLTCNQGDLGVCVGAAPGCTAQAVRGRVWKGPVTISQSGAITRWPPSRAPGEDLVAARGGRRPLLWDGDPHAGRGDICGHGSAHSSAHLTTLPE